MPKFLTPIDLSNLEVRNVLLQNLPTASLPATNRAGQILYDSTVNRPKWNNGSGFVDIFRADTANTVDTVVLRGAGGNFSAGTITATLSGNASTATTLQTARDFSITGKGTAAAVSFNGSGNVALNLTALSVAPGDITLANNLFIVGNSSGVGAATAKNLIAISGFGAAAADVAMGGFKLTGLADPVSAQDAATKGYVDSTAQGLDPKESCHMATTGPLAATYTTGNQRLTGTANGSLTVDGILALIGDRVLVKNQSTASQNGIYVVTQAGDAYTPFILTRSSDFNTSAKASPGSFAFIEEGSTQADTGWVMSSDAVITLDTSNINWVQFSGAGTYTAGRGLVQSGNQFNFAQSTAYTIGDLPYATGASTIGLLSAVATGNALISGGASTAPSWGKIGLTTHVSGTLGVGNGGTGATSVTNNGVAFGSGGVYAFTAAMTAGQIIVANASAVPTPVSVSGDATLSNAGVITLGSNVVTFSKFQQVSGLSVVGNTGSAAANVGAITGTADQVLRVNAAGNALGFGAINLASSNAVTGTLAVANGGTGLSSVGAQYTVLSSTGSAATWTTVDLNNMTSGTLPSSKGGTGSTFFAVAGPTATRTFTFKDQNATVPTFFASTITGDGTTTAFTVTHNLNTRDVMIAVNESVSPWARVYTDDEATSTTTATIRFANAPANGVAYRVVVVGF